MPVSVELKTLNHAVDDLRAALASLRGKYGDVPTVARIRNDLERLQLDVVDVERLPAAPAGSPSSGEIHMLTDEPYDPSLWAEDADDEGLGGYHGSSR
ncbi:MAG: hypothetical protein QOK10_1861 [Pseudonocardiales bacterium]|jgi:hypothetical protein|nr:hypothetical protein [Pseudonocardiales bacterium]